MAAGGQCQDGLTQPSVETGVPWLPAARCPCGTLSDAGTAGTPGTAATGGVPVCGAAPSGTGTAGVAVAGAGEAGTAVLFNGVDRKSVV